MPPHTRRRSSPSPAARTTALRPLATCGLAQGKGERPARPCPRAGAGWRRMALTTVGGPRALRGDASRSPSCRAQGRRGPHILGLGPWRRRFRRGIWLARRVRARATRVGRALGARGRARGHRAQRGRDDRFGPADCDRADARMGGVSRHAPGRRPRGRKPVARNAAAARRRGAVHRIPRAPGACRQAARARRAQPG